MEMLVYKNLAIPQGEFAQVPAAEGPPPGFEFIIRPFRHEVGLPVHRCYNSADEKTKRREELGGIAHNSTLFGQISAIPYFEIL
jgi:hypothetical protein